MKNNLNFNRELKKFKKKMYMDESEHIKKNHLKFIIKNII